jgi:hypothetical protein
VRSVKVVNYRSPIRIVKIKPPIIPPIPIITPIKSPIIVEIRVNPG